MARRGGSGSWFALFPAVGFTGAVVLTLVPNQPFSVQDWPLKGPFGAFTWAAWFTCTGLTFTLVLLALAAALRLRPRRGAGATAGRVLLVAVGFGLLAAAAFAAAARADLIERYPLAALVIAVAVLVAFRRGYVRLRDVAD